MRILGCALPGELSLIASSCCETADQLITVIRNDSLVIKRLFRNAIYPTLATFRWASSADKKSECLNI